MVDDRDGSEWDPRFYSVCCLNLDPRDRHRHGQNKGGFVIRRNMLWTIQMMIYSIG